MNRSILMFSKRNLFFCGGILLLLTGVLALYPDTLSAQQTKRSGGLLRSIISKKSEPNPQQPGDDSVQTLGTASISRKSEKEAITQIPWNMFDAQTQTTVQTLIQSRSLYRRLPMAGGYCNPEIYDFLLCHPEIVIGLWQSLGYSDVSIEKNGEEQYRLREKTGSVADVSILYHDNKKMVLYCAGVYHSTFMAKPLRGETVVLLQYRFTEDANRENAPLTISRADCFIRIENPGVDAVSRTFGPLIGKVIDTNFVKTVDFVNSVSENAETHTEETAESIQQINGVDPVILDELTEIILRSPNLAQLRRQGETVDYFLQPKPNLPFVAAAPLLSRKSQPEVPVPNNAAIAGNTTVQEPSADRDLDQLNVIIDEPSDAENHLTELILDEAPELSDSSETIAFSYSGASDDGSFDIPALTVYRVDSDELPQGPRTVVLLETPVDQLNTKSLYPARQESITFEQEPEFFAPDPDEIDSPAKSSSLLWNKPALN